MSIGEDERRSLDSSAIPIDAKECRDLEGSVTKEHLVSATVSYGKEEAARPADEDSDDDTRASSEDICRICHMGGFPSTADARRRRHNNGASTSTFSSCSYLGPLISACKCRGTVALVHAVCLERWLTESGHTRCELCGYKYATKRVPRHNVFRSAIIWFNTIVATRQMLLDILYLAVTTPLALFACYICALAVKLVLESGFYEVPWVIIAMLPTCSLTLVAYWGWLLTLGRLHGRRWRRYWRNNFVIRLVPENVSDRLSSDTLENNHDEPFADML